MDSEARFTGNFSRPGAEPSPPVPSPTPEPSTETRLREDQIALAVHCVESHAAFAPLYEQRALRELRDTLTALTSPDPPTECPEDRDG